MKNKAFTLIELLVVVLIIGILAAIAVPQYQKATYKSRFVKAKILAKSIANAEEVFYLANGKYTLNIEDLDITIPTADIQPCHNKPNHYKGYCYTDALIFMVIDTDTGLAEVQYSIYKNGKEFIQYAITLAKAENKRFNRVCVAYGPERKPISSEANYQICQGETSDNAPKDWGTTSLSWEYSEE